MGSKPANKSELLLLMMHNQPAIVCLQETLLKTDDDIKIKNHQSYNYINNTGHRALGGVSILTRNDLPQSKINLNTKLKAMAVKVTLHRTINICSLYIPPHDAINENELNILQQLLTPFILLGNFNSHTIWGCRSTNQKGKTLENIINNYNLCLFNKNITLIHLLLPTTRYILPSVTPQFSSTSPGGCITIHAGATISQFYSSVCTLKITTFPHGD